MGRLWLQRRGMSSCCDHHEGSRPGWPEIGYSTVHEHRVPNKGKRQMSGARLILRFNCGCKGAWSSRQQRQGLCSVVPALRPRSGWKDSGWCRYLIVGNIRTVYTSVCWHCTVSAFRGAAPPPPGIGGTGTKTCSSIGRVLNGLLSEFGMNIC